MGRRPVVLVGRHAMYGRRGSVIAALVTTRTRTLTTEVALGSEVGLSRPSVVNADVLMTFDRALLMDRAGALSAEQLAAVDEALRYALDLD